MERARGKRLKGLSEKIFLDRYAWKNADTSGAKPGDVVLVLTKDDPKFPAKEVGEVVSRDGHKVTVRLQNGDLVDSVVEKLTLTIEKTPEEMWDRLAGAMASVETVEQKQKEWQEKFRYILDDWKLVPGGRIAAGAGASDELTLFNCYVIPSPKDSRGGIMKTLTEMTEIMARGGGVGMNLSSLRPQRTIVAGVNGSSSGAVSWGGLFSYTTGLIEQGGCFGPEERIATNKGLIKAEELADRMDMGESFQAATHAGMRPITFSFRNGIKPVFRVRTARGYQVDVTKDHKMGILQDGIVKTAPLRELNVGSNTLLLISEQQMNQSYAGLTELVYERSAMSTKLKEVVNFPAELDERLAYVLGYFYGDGYVHWGRKVTWEAPKAIKLATADDRPLIRERLTQYIRELFGLEPIVEKGDGACSNVTVYSRQLVEWLSQNGILKQKSGEVRVPELLFKSPSSVMASFISGYFDADGCDRGSKGGYGFDSISQPMLQDVQKLLAANGILSHINESVRSTSGWQTIYRLAVTGAEFKQRMNEFMVMSVKNKSNAGRRNHGNGYPREVWKQLEVPGRYYQGVWDSTKPSISYRALSRIKERLLEDSQVALAARVEELLQTVPDTIVSIEPLGTMKVYDFEVDDVHMLSGNGLYTSNSRRGALMLMINDWHPDVLDFITVKQTMGQVTNANLSVCVSNAFMRAVKEDLEWDLVFPDTKEEGYDELWTGDLEQWRRLGKKVNHYKTVRARDIWHLIIESAWKSAEPGVVFMDYYNQMSNSWYFNPIISTNPCGEQGLPGWGVCNLSAVNLSKFYDEEKHDVAWEELAKVTRWSVRFLDNVIEKTPYHFEENEHNQKRERRIGLGTMGLAELMIKLGIRYGSPESLVFLDKLYGFMARESYLSSTEIAAEKGSFLAFETDKYVQSGFMKHMIAAYPEIGEAIARSGMRNVTVLTQAPTGSTGTMVGTSTGIEPYFAFEYFRQSRLGFDKQYVPIAQAWKDAHPGEELPDYFVTAMSLSAEDHIRVQAAIQRWVDSSISKTANAPSDFTVEDTKRLYELAFELGCKGVTIYRDGSRDVQVLSTKKEEPAEEKAVSKDDAKEADALPAAAIDAPFAESRVEPAVPAAAKGDLVLDKQYKSRPQVLRGATYKVNTPFGMAYITINDLNGTPGEIFLNVGKAGSDVFAMAEALGRVCSLFLRYGDHGNKVKLLIKHLKGIGGSGAIGFGVNRVESIADAVAKSLEIHMESGEEQAASVEADALPAYEAGAAEPSAAYDKHDVSASASRDLCPSCGSATLINIEGCKQCSNCGYSKCS
ncbi:adenosylcobalamin-dependent ribonucleoside-diphosphate reductase [Paenibacillus arenilitoris]|uniref:adenosylcobalamin-dependent ribonucleoside-diphosphate reductase n=1 Tax=Paenibacillus arenilitoris TaxID=2772299 RepID=UPI001CC23B4C|nr:adenosylcobalamin-dependent ribonucleoside-diphosphate reductase [Paenibacillus arenilitoris]